jgi:hypothetical protein
MSMRLKTSLQDLKALLRNSLDVRTGMNIVDRKFSWNLEL